MPKTLSMIWVHLVWSTKDREPTIKKSFRGELNKLLKSESAKRDILIDTINGMEDHIHVLVRIKPTQTVSEVVNWIKGYSSRWINETYYSEGVFKWQKGYGAFSVGRKEIESVRRYIYLQEQHHRKQNYRQEILKLT